MTDSSVEYNVVINGILPGHKTGAVADAVAPLLGLLPEDAKQLFNGVANTVLQRVDLSAAASFQARLKNIGVDASVAVFEDNRSPSPAAAEAPAAPTEEPAAPAKKQPAPVAEQAAPVSQSAAPEPVQVEQTAQADATPAAMDIAAAPEFDAVKPAAADNKGSDIDIELDISLIEQSQATPADPEPDDIFDAFDKEAADQEDQRQADEQAEKQHEKAAQPTPAPSPAPAADLDELFDGSNDGIADAPPAPPAPAPAPETPALAMEEAPGEEAVAERSGGVVTEEVMAVATGVDAARALDATPFQDASPGSNMLCPSCNTLQMRADQCPGCGALINAPAEETARRKPRLPPRLPTASIVAAAGAAVMSVGIWLALAYTLDFDTGVLALVTGVLAGMACGLTGGRGSKAGATSAAIALIAIVGATVLLPREVATEQPAPPQPDAAEAWSDTEAPAWFKQAESDAELFMTIDGSAAAVRDFMVRNRYTLAKNPQQVPQADLRYFYDVDAADLTWIVENQPDLEAWSQRMRGHLSGRQRVRLNVSAPLLEPVPEGPTTLQLIFMLLGIAAAFGLGQFGLRRDS